MTLPLYVPKTIRPVWYPADLAPLTGMAVGRQFKQRRDGTWEERMEFLLDGDGSEEQRTRWYWKSEVVEVS